MTTDVFTPSLVRRGLDELLVRYPHLDLIEVNWDEPQLAHRVEFQSPWVLVTLGQRSQGEIPAWARWHFAIWRSTGSVYRMLNESGPVEEDPYITVSEEEG